MVTGTKPEVEQDELIPEGFDNDLKAEEAEEEEPTGKREEPTEEEEETSEEKPETISFANQGELDKHIQAKAQTLADSIANKSTATYQQKVAELQKEIRQLKDVKEDDALARLEGAQTEEWGKTQEVGDFQEAVRKTIQERREFRDKVAEWEERHEKATQSAREVNAFTEALGLLLPEDEAGFIANLTELAKKIAGAETDREKALLIELEKAKLTAPVEEKPKRTKPDSNISSLPGSFNASNLSDEEKIAKGLEQERKKMRGG